MGRFASDTTVSVERSRAEIEATLSRYGASHFAVMTAPDAAAIAFQVRDRRVRFELPLPSKTDRAFTHTPGRHTPRSSDDAWRAWEQGCRQRWRALALAIKAKLEAVECGITTFDEEFLAHIILPNGQTVGRWASPQIERAYESGDMPPLMLGDGAK